MQRKKVGNNFETVVPTHTWAALNKVKGQNRDTRISIETCFYMPDKEMWNETINCN